MKFGNLLLLLIFLVAAILIGCVSQQQTKSPENSAASSAGKISPNQTIQKTNAKDDLGCWPPSCSFISDPMGKQMCEDWKAGKQVTWYDCSFMSAFPACVKLCEAEKKNNPQPTGGSSEQNYTQQPTQQPQQQPTGGDSQQNYCPNSGISKDENPDNAYVYIADLGKHRLIRMDDMGGTGWVSFGSLGDGVNQFNEPKQLARDKQGRIYISDQINARIVRIDDITGKGWVSYSEPIRSAGSGSGQRLWGVDLDSKGRIYFTSREGDIGRIDDMSGKGLVKFGETSGSGVNQFHVTKVIQIDQQDRIYIGDSLNNRIVRIDDMTGKNWVSFGKLGTGIGEFQRTSGYAFDSQGRIYIADEDNNRIVRIDDMTGNGWIEFGGIEGNPLRLPNGITISKSGRFYISDTRNNRVVRIDDMTGKGWKVYGLCRELGPPGDPLRESQYQMIAPKAMLIVEK